MLRNSGTRQLHVDDESSEEDGDQQQRTLSFVAEEERQMSHFEIGELDSSSESSGILDLGEAEFPESHIYTTDVELQDVEAIVVAPCDLPEGYVLRVDLGDGRTLVTQIPFGGVTRGDVFTTLYRIHGQPPPVKPKRKKDVRFLDPDDEHWRPATEKWKADLCGCCEFGPCHPSYLGACCLNCLLLPQIMTRMNLNWYGRRLAPGMPRSSLARDTFTLVFLFFVAFYIVLVVTDALSIKAIRQVEEETEEEAMRLLYSVSAIRAVSFIVFSGFVLLLLTRTRRAIREHYRIPGSVGNDCCVSCFCHVCVLSQMARQSADYHRQPARWCTDTGLSDEVEYDGFNATIPNDRASEMVIDLDCDEFVANVPEDTVMERDANMMIV